MAFVFVIVAVVVGVSVARVGVLAVVLGRVQRALGLTTAQANPSREKPGT